VPLSASAHQEKVFGSTVTPGIAQAPTSADSGQGSSESRPGGTALGQGWESLGACTEGSSMSLARNMPKRGDMRRPRSRVHRLLPMSAEAWVAAEELAAVARVSAAEFVEYMLLELLLHHRSQASPEPTPRSSEQLGAVSISQARHKRRHRSGAPRAS
jgi:hypothetical protein